MPRSPAILDLGCGGDAQTIHLAELTTGSILAIDNHAPAIERLQAVIAERGLAHRVSAIVADMARPEQPPESFDLIWSEGALYNIGIGNTLRICHGLLRPGGRHWRPRPCRCRADDDGKGLGAGHFPTSRTLRNDPERPVPQWE